MKLSVIQQLVLLSLTVQQLWIIYMGSLAFTAPKGKNGVFMLLVSNGYSFLLVSPCVGYLLWDYGYPFALLSSVCFLALSAMNFHFVPRALREGLKREEVKNDLA